MVYIDNARVAYKGNLYCHMLADSLDELHEFAEVLGIKKCWFHGSASYPHYDVKIEFRPQAINLGAILSSRKQIIECGKRLRAQKKHRKHPAFIVQQQALPI